ncbi:hypothetical protein O9993_03260 [Vibrio lentus]|nr:hypothetical protein [Vibrio lentus]
MCIATIQSRATEFMELNSLPYALLRIGSAFSVKKFSKADFGFKNSFAARRNFGFRCNELNRNNDAQSIRKDD